MKNRLLTADGAVLLAAGAIGSRDPRDASIRIWLIASAALLTLTLAA